MTDEADRKEDEGGNEGGIGVEIARANFSDLVLRAGYGNERIAITRKGRRAAYLIGIKDYERLVALDAADAANVSTDAAA